MPFINDRLYDLGLNVLDTEANRLDICSSEPATFAAATTTVSLGNKTTLSIGAPAAGSPSGRKVTIAAFSDGTVTATGTATHYAITDTVNSRLLVTGALSASQVVTSGNTFSITATDVTLRGLT